MRKQFWSSKHVIVTGGAGFLGSSIVRQLHNRSVGACGDSPGLDFGAV
jgi:nucleoside-diphosphate-sugar epimerase